MESVFDFSEPLQQSFIEDVALNSSLVIPFKPQANSSFVETKFMDLVRALRQEFYNECKLDFMTEDLPANQIRVATKNIKVHLKELDQSWSSSYSVNSDNWQELMELVGRSYYPTFINAYMMMMIAPSLQMSAIS